MSVANIGKAIPDDIRHEIDGVGFDVYEVAESPDDDRRLKVGIRGHTLGNLTVYHPPIEFDSETIDDLEAWRKNLKGLADTFDPWVEAHRHLGCNGEPLDYAAHYFDGAQIYRECLYYKDEQLMWLVTAIEAIDRLSPIDGAIVGASPRQGGSRTHEANPRLR